MSTKEGSYGYLLCARIKEIYDGRKIASKVAVPKAVVLVDVHDPCVEIIGDL